MSQEAVEYSEAKFVGSGVPKPAEAHRAGTGEHIRRIPASQALGEVIAARAFRLRYADAAADAVRADQVNRYGEGHSLTAVRAAALIHSAAVEDTETTADDSLF